MSTYIFEVVEFNSEISFWMGATPHSLGGRYLKIFFKNAHMSFFRYTFWSPRIEISENVRKSSSRPILINSNLFSCEYYRIKYAGACNRKRGFLEPKRITNIFFFSYKFDTIMFTYLFKAAEFESEIHFWIGGSPHPLGGRFCVNLGKIRICRFRINIIRSRLIEIF